MTINDGQLDHANREIETLRKCIYTLSEVCSRRFDLLKRVIEINPEIDSECRCVFRLSPQLYGEIVDETDESEVEP